jgi:hypothetical protein
VSQCSECRQPEADCQCHAIDVAVDLYHEVVRLRAFVRQIAELRLCDDPEAAKDCTMDSGPILRHA